MVYCLAYGCNSRQTKGCWISFFRFPKDKTFCKQWVHYCKRADFTEPTLSSRLCSKHFSGDQYERDPVKRARYGYENAQTKLKDGAISDIPLVKPVKEASKTDHKTGVRGAYERRQRAEVGLLFHIFYLLYFCCKMNQQLLCFRIKLLLH